MLPARILEHMCSSILAGTDRKHQVSLVLLPRTAGRQHGGWHRQKTTSVHSPMLGQGWVNVYDTGPALNQHWDSHPVYVGRPPIIILSLY